MQLEVEKVVKQYAGHLALDHVSLTVPENTIYGLLGPNGAGKTTLLRIINCITAPDSGEVRIGGHPLNINDIPQIGYLPEERGLYRNMKVGEQALYLARLKGMSKHDARQALFHWFEKLEIMPWWDKKIDELSKGMAQKVQFVTTVLHKPQLLIFDEPFSGFDPLNSEILTKEILELRNQGATIIFSTHNMSTVEDLCENISLINQSQIVLQGNVQEIRQAHTTNTYRISHRDKLKTNHFQIISQSTNSNPLVSIIQKPEQMTNNELLQLIIQQSEIFSFEELLPDMNDIFIQTVQQSKA